MDGLSIAYQYVRIKIFQILGKRGNLSLIDALIATLGHWNSNVQKEARDALVKIGQPAMYELITALMFGYSTNVGTNVRDALNKIDPSWPKSEAAKKQIPDFITALKEKRNRFSGISADAAKVLGEIWDARPVDELIALLRNTNPFVRINTRYVLDKIDPSWPKSEAAKKQIPDFIAAIKENRNRFSSVSADAAMVLGEIGDTRALDGLIAALRHWDSNVRRNARSALDKIDATWANSEVAKKHVPEFISALRHHDPNLREDVRDALDKIDSTWTNSEAAKKHVPEFIAALKDRYLDVGSRADTAKVLGDIGDARAVDVLIAVLRDTDSAPRRNARAALDKIDATWANSEVAKKHVPEFISALRHHDPNLREDVRDALDKIDSTWPKSEAVKKQVPDFIEALGQKDSYIQKNARDLLVKIGKPAVDELISALRHWDSNVRRNARAALDEIDATWAKSEAAKRQIPEFIDALKARYLDIGSRSEAAKVLGEIGDARAVDGLIAVLKDKDVRVNVSIALKMISKLQSPLLISYPFLFCRVCHFRPEKKKVKARSLPDFNYVICRGCNSSLHLIKDVKEVIGFIGDEREGYKIDGEKIYIKLWSEAEKKAMNADIDIIEIRNSPSVNYDYAINAVLNTLVNDISRPRDFVKNIPVVLKGNIPISENSRHLLNHKFGGIHYLL